MLGQLPRFERLTCVDIDRRSQRLSTRARSGAEGDRTRHRSPFAALFVAAPASRERRRAASDAEPTVTSVTNEPAVS